MCVDVFCDDLSTEDQSGYLLCVGVGRSGCEVFDDCGIGVGIMGVDVCCVVLWMMSCLACFRVGH